MTLIRRLTHGQFLGESSPLVRASGFSFAEVAHTPAVHVPLHTHDDAHFVLLMRGEYATSARRIGRGSTAPALIFNPPGTTHRDHFASSSGRFFTISIAPAQFSRLSTVHSSFTHPVSFGSAGITTLAQRMVVECRSPDSLSGVVLEGLGLELLACTARVIRADNGRAPPAWLSRAVELMRDGCCTSLSVREVATEVGVHPYHLARTARTYLGKSPGEILREYRLEHALGLLTRSILSLSDIAARCGYADQSQFTRSFKCALGTTPAAFRRRAGAPARAAQDVSQ